MTLVPVQQSTPFAASETANNEAVAASGEVPHSPEFQPHEEITGVCIGLAAILIPLSVVLADAATPVANPYS
jgi:hypothetical protein